MIKKSRLLYISYLTKNSIITIIKVSIEKKKIVTLIDKKKINVIITTLIKRIKGFLKTKCKFNLKIKIMKKVFMNIKRDFLKVNIFEIEDNIKSFSILKKIMKREFKS